MGGKTGVCTQGFLAVHRNCEDTGAIPKKHPMQVVFLFLSMNGSLQFGFLQPLFFLGRNIFHGFVVMR